MSSETKPNVVQQAHDATPLTDQACEVCGFKLHNPIKSLSVSDLAFYNDSRFRGRSILALRLHRDQWDEVVEGLLLKFLQDSQKAVKAIRVATGCARVNVASLGNSVSHIHLHLIPRFPDEESVPNGAPWRDPRPQTELPATEAKELMHKIASLL